jgi:hypothetical protein
VAAADYTVNAVFFDYLQAHPAIYEICVDGSDCRLNELPGGPNAPAGFQRADSALDMIGAEIPFEFVTKVSGNPPTAVVRVTALNGKKAIVLNETARVTLQAENADITPGPGNEGNPNDPNGPIYPAIDTCTVGYTANVSLDAHGNLSTS